jgi:hypothetical protein
MVTYGLPVVYTLNINLINYGEDRFFFITRRNLVNKKRVI